MNRVELQNHQPAWQTQCSHNKLNTGFNKQYLSATQDEEALDAFLFFTVKIISIIMWHIFCAKPSVCSSISCHRVPHWNSKQSTDHRSDKHSHSSSNSLIHTVTACCFLTRFCVKSTLTRSLELIAGSALWANGWFPSWGNEHFPPITFMICAVYGTKPLVMVIPCIVEISSLLSSPLMPPSVLLSRLR